MDGCFFLGGVVGFSEWTLSFIEVKRIKSAIIFTKAIMIGGLMSTNSLTATNIANVFDINLIYARKLFQSVGENSTLEDVQKLVNSKPKPFVKWVGGKRQLLRQFRELGLYPPEDFNPITNTYYEPFVGACAVLSKLDTLFITVLYSRLKSMIMNTENQFLSNYNYAVNF